VGQTRRVEIRALHDPVRDAGAIRSRRVPKSPLRLAETSNADDADGRGSSPIKPERIGVNPLYARHPHSINPYTDVKTALAPDLKILVKSETIFPSFTHHLRFIRA
jgi:hypothetical protein